MMSLAFDDGSPIFIQGSSMPRTTCSPACAVSYMALTFSDQTSQTVRILTTHARWEFNPPSTRRIPTHLLASMCTNPTHQDCLVFSAHMVSLATTSILSFDFFPPGTEMFHFPGFFRPFRSRFRLGNLFFFCRLCKFQSLRTAYRSV
jgi:hypothetical protein